MENQTPNILVTMDAHYLPQLKVMLTSLFMNDPGRYEIYLMHRAIPDAELERLRRGLERAGSALHVLPVHERMLEGAPVTRQYPQEMYYRLLAPHILPDEVERILYLDPDVLVINPIRALWNLDMEGRAFAAASHTGKTELANSVNHLRLGTEGKYYNSGVMMMDLGRARACIRLGELYSFVESHSGELLLPDQDVLNVLYGRDILEIDDFIWNYDARKYSSYFLRSMGNATEEWVMQNTAILHFCGKAKPWKPRYPYRFGILYRHYMQHAQRFWDAAVPSQSGGAED